MEILPLKYPIIALHNGRMLHKGLEKICVLMLQQLIIYRLKTLLLLVMNSIIQMYITCKCGKQGG